VLYQLQSKEPLFKRCISMSGTPIMLKPLLLEVAEVSYALIMKELGLENASPETRIQKLRTIEPEELVEKIPMGIPLLPVLDGDIVLQPITFAKLAMSAAAVPDPTWCEDLIIGDCQHDGNVFFFMGLAQQKSDIASALTTSLHVNLPAAAANAVLDAYNLCYATGDNEAMKRIIDLGTDIAYAGPALAYARSFPGKAYYYQFNEPNPWDGQFEGCSTHMLDAAFLFQNYSKHLSNDAHRVGRALALDFVKFANGVKPWDEYDKEVGQVRMYGPSITSVVDIVKNNGWTKGRRNTLWELSDKGTIDLDQLSIAWDMFVARKPYNTTG
jgi:carboxylesterase type B